MSPSPVPEKPSSQGGSSGAHPARKQSSSIPEMLAPATVSGIEPGDAVAGPYGIFASRATAVAMVSIWACAIVASTWIPVREMWPGFTRLERKAVRMGPAQPKDAAQPPSNAGGSVPRNEGQQQNSVDKPKALASGELRVESEPSAKIFIDQKAYGSTPASLQLSQGPRKLVLIADGYKLWSKDITSSEPLSIKLVRAELPEEVRGPAVVNVECKTTDSLRILVDGHDTGQTCPAEELHLSVGSHRFGFLNPVTGEQNENQMKVRKGKSAAKLKVRF